METSTTQSDVELHPTLAALESPFDTELDSTSIKGAMKVHGGKSNELWMVDPKHIRVLPNFNVRVEKPALQNVVREYADSMLANGWLVNSVLAGFTAIDPVTNEPVIYVTDGHTRLKALALATAEGGEFGPVPMTIKTKGVSMSDLQFNMMQINKSNPLSDYEKAVNCKRLFDGGVSMDVISTRSGIKKPKLEKLFKLMAAPNKLREMVAFDVISTTFAIEMIEQHGSKALAIIEEGLEVAQGKGKAKVTRKHVVGTQYTKFVKTAAPKMHSTLAKVKEDPGFNGLSDEVKSLLNTLLDEIESKKTEDGPEVDPRQTDFIKNGELAHES